MTIDDATPGFVECGWCGQHFDFTTLNEYADALIAAEYEHKDGGALCEAVGRGGEHLIKLAGREPFFARVRSTDADEIGDAYYADVKQEEPA